MSRPRESTPTHCTQSLSMSKLGVSIAACAASPRVASTVAQAMAITPKVQSRRVRDRSMAAPHSERVRNATE